VNNMGADSRNALVVFPDERAVSTRDRPKCPRCGEVMYLRRAGTGPRKDERFWGCGNFFSTTKKCSQTINISKNGVWYGEQPRKEFVPYQSSLKEPYYKKYKPIPIDKKVFIETVAGPTRIHILEDNSEEQLARRDEFVVTMMYIPTGKITHVTITENELTEIMKDFEIEIQQILQSALTNPNTKYDVTDRHITDEYIMR
jgi:hypothetical protein